MASGPYGILFDSIYEFTEGSKPETRRAVCDDLRNIIKNRRKLGLTRDTIMDIDQMELLPDGPYKSMANIMFASTTDEESDEQTSPAVVVNTDEVVDTSVLSPDDVTITLKSVGSQEFILKVEGNDQRNVSIAIQSGPRLININIAMRDMNENLD